MFCTASSPTSQPMKKLGTLKGFAAHGVVGQEHAEGSQRGDAQVGVGHGPIIPGHHLLAHQHHGSWSGGCRPGEKMPGYEAAGVTKENR